MMKAACRCCRPRHRRPRQTNASVTKLLNDVRTDVETGTSLSAAFRKYPLYFDNLYCNLVEAGEAAGILEALLDRLAVYMEKTEAIKSKIKSALMYPISVVVVASWGGRIMIFVIPPFRKVQLFGATCRPHALGSHGRGRRQYWWRFRGSAVGFYFLARPGSEARRCRFHDRSAEEPHCGALI